MNDRALILNVPNSGAYRGEEGGGSAPFWAQTMEGKI